MRQTALAFFTLAALLVAFTGCHAPKSDTTRARVAPDPVNPLPVVGAVSARDGLRIPPGTRIEVVVRR